VMEVGEKKSMVHAHEMEFGPRRKEKNGLRFAVSVGGGGKGRSLLLFKEDPIRSWEGLLLSKGRGNT